MPSRECPVCRTSSTIKPAGSRYSTFSQRDFHFGRCSTCEIAIVLDPRTDYDELYSEDYYRGLGVDSTFKSSNQMPSRQLEFSGLERMGKSLTKSSKARWLDFGGGSGAFARHLRQRGWDAYAIDDGWAREQLIAQSLLWDGSRAEFDLISAIEVVEHLIDPRPVLEEIFALLKPGGYFFITTGNVAKARDLSRWHYSKNPEVHVTFWNPTAWEIILRSIGFDTLDPINVDPSVIQHKVVTSLGKLSVLAFRTRKLWRLAVPIIDRRFGVTAFAVGQKPF